MLVSNVGMALEGPLSRATGKVLTRVMWETDD
jgi:hypothetical protein